MSTIDSILDKLKVDQSALIEKARQDIKAIPPPPPPSTDFVDDFSEIYSLIDGQVSPNGKWKVKYLSGGVIEAKNGTLHMAPKAVTSPSQTSAPELLSTKVFKNFTLDLDMKTNRQLRTGSAPNSWEAAWVFWRFTDEDPKSNHHYYFVIKTTGCEFCKKDNPPNDTTLEQQIFLATPATPKLRIGMSNHITIISKDFHFTIKVDGVVVVDMTDMNVRDPTKMAQGLIGLYAEDADVSFDNVKLVTQ